jgi:hypothetical protein
MSWEELFNETLPSELQHIHKTSSRTNLKTVSIKEEEIRKPKSCENQIVVLNQNNSTGLIVLSLIFVIVVISLCILLPKWKPRLQR